MNNRIISFDIIRGVSAIFVMLFHNTFRFNQLNVSSPVESLFTVSWGFAAVILSGYFLGNNSTMIILIPVLIATGLGYILNEYAETLFCRMVNFCKFQKSKT